MKFEIYMALISLWCCATRRVLPIFKLLIGIYESERCSVCCWNSNGIYRKWLRFISLTTIEIYTYSATNHSINKCSHFPCLNIFTYIHTYVCVNVSISKTQLQINRSIIQPANQSTDPLTNQSPTYYYLSFQSEFDMMGIILNYKLLRHTLMNILYWWLKEGINKKRFKRFSEFMN